MGRAFNSVNAGKYIDFRRRSRPRAYRKYGGGERRSIEEPGTQVSFRGPRQGFTESIQTNVSMIRRYIKNPNVWVEKMKIGTVTHTEIALMYINGICEDKTIKEVKQRLKKSISTAF